MVELLQDTFVKEVSFDCSFHTKGSYSPPTGQDYKIADADTEQQLPGPVKGLFYAYIWTSEQKFMAGMSNPQCGKLHPNAQLQRNPHFR